MDNNYNAIIITNTTNSAQHEHNPYHKLTRRSQTCCVATPAEVVREASGDATAGARLSLFYDYSRLKRKP